MYTIILKTERYILVLKYQSKSKKVLKQLIKTAQTKFDASYPNPVVGSVPEIIPVKPGMLKDIPKLKTLRGSSFATVLTDSDYLIISIRNNSMYRYINESEFNRIKAN
jgi:hypothetical protein